MGAVDQFELHEKRRQRVNAQDYVCFVQGDARARWRSACDIRRSAAAMPNRWSMDAHLEQRWAAALYAAARALYRERWEK